MDSVADDEILLRRVPQGSPWHEPNGRVTSAAFRLARNENGLSVFRAAIVSPQHVLSALAGAIVGSSLVAATAGEIRAALDGNGKPLELDVIPDDEDGANPGHALIVSPDAGRFGKSVPRALKQLFRSYP